MSAPMVLCEDDAVAGDAPKLFNEDAAAAAVTDVDPDDMVGIANGARCE
jgi:hypothetical protein